MAENSLETVLFAQAIKRVQTNLKILDLQLDEGSRRESIWRNLRFKWHFWFNVLLLNIVTVGETVWIVKGVSTGISFIDLCYQAPCLTLCIVCNILCAYFVKHTHKILDLVTSIRALQSMSTVVEESDVMLLKSQVKMFYMVVNILTVTKCLAISSFGLIPFVTMCLSYHSTGEVQLVLPFLVVYPFDSTVINFWPIAYVHQIWAALLACLILLTPSYLCYACSTFIIFQFYLLRNDLKKIIPYENNLDTYYLNVEMKINFKKIIHRHRKLIKCVDKMKEVYSESNLFNAVISSILICFTGFNAMTIDDLALAVPFLPFLLMDLLQIFFICYYGDMIMRYSTSISYAVYECQWYRAEPAIVKDFLFLSLRAQKPCHLTALRFTDISLKTFTRSTSISYAVYECQWYRAEPAIVKDFLFLSLRAQKPCHLTALRFTDISLKTFTRILSTSWSYFALLKSMYRN